MPVKMNSTQMLSAFFTFLRALLLGGSLTACGGGSGTTRITETTVNNESEATPTAISVKLTIPVEIKNAHIAAYLLTSNHAFYDNSQFSGFSVSIPELTSDKYAAKLVRATLRGDGNSQIYDPILNQYVPFEGELHAIGVIENNELTLAFNLASEAIFQRTLVRAGNLNLTDPNFSLIQNKHLTKARADVMSSLNDAFYLTNFPEINSHLSLISLSYSTSNRTEYLNLFKGLGLVQLWANQHPDEQNAYYHAAKNIAIDMRDGYLDGRSIMGDTTEFIPMVEAPKNLDPALNTNITIGATQQSARETFGEAFKEATLSYAYANFQNIYNPDGYSALQQHDYYSKTKSSASTTNLRWIGAGDYRSPFGFTQRAGCETISTYGCKTGLNADDLVESYSDIEYLIGSHTVGNCTVEFLATGTARIIQNGNVYTANINRDLVDNLIKLDDSNHYILNVGSSEFSPSYFLQFEIEDLLIKHAAAGYSSEAIPLTLHTPELSCN